MVLSVMQQSLLLSCNKQLWCHAANIGVRQQAALVSYNKQNFGHATSSIAAMQQVAALL
jgi:hypothetical protein